MWVAERSRRGIQFERDEVLGNRDDAGLFLQFLFQHLTEHALAKVVKVSQSLLKALAHLERGHGRRDHLGVRVFQAGAGVDPVILEDRNVRDARVEAEFIVASLIDMEDFRHVGIGHQGQNLRVVGRLHNHIVNSKAVYRSAQTVYRARRRCFAGKSRKFIGYYARVPRNIHGGRYAQNFRRSQLLVARTKRAVRDKRCHRLPLAVARHFFRTAGALGCDHNPFLSSKILTQF